MWKHQISLSFDHTAHGTLNPMYFQIKGRSHSACGCNVEFTESDLKGIFIAPPAWKA